MILKMFMAEDKVGPCFGLIKKWGAVLQIERTNKTFKCKIWISQHNIWPVQFLLEKNIWVAW